MRKSRRQIVLRIAEAAGLGLVLLDVVLYFAVCRPLAGQVATEEHRYSQARQTVRDQQLRVERLQRYQAALPQAGKQLEDFTANCVPSRRKGFSTAAHLVKQAADTAGVQLSSVAYRLDTAQRQPMESLGLEINVSGPYAGLLKFAHALETTNELILIREFNLVAADNGALGLRLIVDLPLIP